MFDHYMCPNCHATAPIVYLEPSPEDWRPGYRVVCHSCHIMSYGNTQAEAERNFFRGINALVEPTLFDNEPGDVC